MKPEVEEAFKTECSSELNEPCTFPCIISESGIIVDHNFDATSLVKSFTETYPNRSLTDQWKKIVTKAVEKMEENCERLKEKIT